LHRQPIVANFFDDVGDVAMLDAHGFAEELRIFWNVFGERRGAIVPSNFS